MKVTFKSLVGTLVALFALVPLLAHADVPTVSVAFTISANGSTPDLAIPGDNSCGIQFVTVGSAATITAQGAVDQVPTYSQTITNFGTAGVITNPTAGASYVAGVAPNALTYIHFAFTGVTGTYTGRVTCTSAGAAGSSGGGAAANVTVINGTANPVPVSIPSSTVAVTVSANIPVLDQAVNPSNTATPLSLDANGRLLTTTPPPYVAPTCSAAPNAPCVQITGPLTVNTSAPYVAPTCPAAPNGPCVQMTGPIPAGTNAYGVHAGINGSGTINGASQGVTINMNGQSALSFSISGTWTGTLQFEGDAGLGTFPNNFYCTNANTASQYNTSANSTYVCGNIPWYQVRIYSTAWTSGTATVTYHTADFGQTYMTAGNGNYAQILSSALFTTTGGSATTSVATGAGNTVVKNNFGRLVCGLVTTAGTGTGNETVYDNASTNSGTILGLIPATVTVTGTPYCWNNYAANGITVNNVANGPVVTFSYY